MKKFILGCVLLVSGILGGTGWVLARSIMAASYGWNNLSHLFNFNLWDYSLERLFVIAFYLVAIIGAVIAIVALKKDK